MRSPPLAGLLCIVSHRVGSGVPVASTHFDTSFGTHAHLAQVIARFSTSVFLPRELRPSIVTPLRCRCSLPLRRRLRSRNWRRNDGRGNACRYYSYHPACHTAV